ncbi:PKD domain-containing protein [Gelidibacter japonicus]|uniref:PKD domain-containing protein n=1 Tax=Gelidibacter japonicus TaxID=1962232 RepID=UPI0020207244|nr:PKD domain-containing protein [Gelidibacter japonicus]MCL8006882.1 PKD domain-containing protein [Gelidibacter japonicus]
MKNSFIIFFLMTIGICFQSCSDDDFPVPPASTVPSFTYTISNDEFAPATVTFTNTSIVPGTVGNATYYWNFGDGNSSTETSPTYIYNEAGVYVVNLVVTTSGSLEIKESSQTIVIKDPNATGTPIYFTDGTKVYQGLINTQAPIFTPINGLVAQTSYGMAMDTLNNKLYISDYGANKIFRANLDGSNFEEFRTNVDSPIGMAFDYEENQLYFNTSSGVQRSDLSSTDLSQVEDFVTGQANDPDGLAIDLVNRKLYWINYDGGVWSKNLDGTGETEIIPGVEGASIIVVGNRIYYDEYVASGDIRIKSANLDGTGITTIAVGVSRVVYGLAYDPYGEKLYWGDRRAYTMMRANLDGSDAEIYYQGTAGISGIVIGKRP